MSDTAVSGAIRRKDVELMRRAGEALEAARLDLCTYCRQRMKLGEHGHHVLPDNRTTHCRARLIRAVINDIDERLLRQ